MTEQIKSRVKDVQLFIHRHYDTIKLSLLVVLVILAVATLQNMWSAETRRATYELRQAKERGQELLRVAEEISREQQNQHDQQDKRHTCFFELFISYVNTRQPIEKADADNCRVIPAETGVIVPSATSTPAPVLEPSIQHPGKSQSKKDRR